MGKLESSPVHLTWSPNFLPWHAHITAVTVAPEARRLGIGRLLTEKLEVAADAGNAFFVDLFVRRSNSKAIAFYESMGYSVFRVVRDYYGGSASEPAEDAFDMRKPMRRDAKREHVRDNGLSHVVSAQDVW